MSDSNNEHESFIKTPQQLIVVGVLAFTVPVILLIMMAKFVISVSPPNEALVSAEAVASRIKPVAEITVADAGAGGGAAKSGENIVKVACAACHATGAAGAPKIGDNAAWAKRLGLGLNGLLQSAIKGKGAMPPKGGTADLSDYELARAIVYMANQSGGSLKEPSAPKADAAKKK